MIFARKGGVGKATLACATAVRPAREFPGREILLFCIDPAHSLSACLKADIGTRPLCLPTGLSAVAINAQALLLVVNILEPQLNSLADLIQSQ